MRGYKGDATLCGQCQHQCLRSFDPAYKGCLNVYKDNKYCRCCGKILTGREGDHIDDTAYRMSCASRNPTDL